jgi:hypothetical protein
MKHLKYFESHNETKIDNPDIDYFAKIYNKQKGYENKAVYYSNSSPTKYVSVTDNPYENFGYLIVGDLKLEQFIRNAKDNGMSNTLYMRALTNKVNQKFHNSKVINVSFDGNFKLDISKKKPHVE